MKKRALLSLLLCLTLLLCFVGCSASYDNDAMMGGDMKEDYGTTTEGATADNVISADRKIIKTVNERVETDAYDDMIAGLKTAVTEMGGYLVSSSYSGNGVESDRTRYASFEIRIPAEKLSEFTGKVGTLGTVLSYNEKAEDVTLAYVDIESRLAVLEAEETALLAILEKAESTSEIVEIRKSLTDTQASLASLRAQKTTYDTLVAYSTVYLTVNEVAHARSADRTFFSEVGDGLRASTLGIGRFFRGAGVFLLGYSPVLILIAAVGVGAFFLVRILRRKTRKPKTQPPTEGE